MALPLSKITDTISEESETSQESQQFNIQNKIINQGLDASESSKESSPLFKLKRENFNNVSI